MLTLVSIFSIFEKTHHYIILSLHPIFPIIWTIQKYLVGRISRMLISASSLLEAMKSHLI